MEDNQTAVAKKPMSKTEILASLSEATDLAKQQIGGLLDELATLIGKKVLEALGGCSGSRACSDGEQKVQTADSNPETGKGH